ncbi:hypothetical protein Zmor_003785 [Zophobas morio]|uniref:Transposable element P transposase-like RNase H domain-containing protein n=1 Tax=Zophobas morio TaxID=2755281 RepID=A0AA38M217_9CUCU|nr:hypothetical protein Zmor_003785 [Zophobas morio]
MVGTSDISSSGTTRYLLESGKLKMHYCFFCKSLKTTIARHLTKKHAKEPETAKILLPNVDIEERRKVLEDLRRRGDKIYNEKNIALGLPHRIVRRQSKSSDLKSYLPCPNCKVWYSRRNVARHEMQCTGRKPTDKSLVKTLDKKEQQNSHQSTLNKHVERVHFAPEMWEKPREDVKRKLKLNAVPTIFSFNIPKRERKPPKTRVVSAKLDPQPSTSRAILSSSSSTSSSRATSPVLQHMETQVVEMQSTEVLKKLDKCDEIIKKMSKQNIELKAKLKIAQRKIRKLQTVSDRYKSEVKDNKYFKLISQTFNPDQIYAMQLCMQFHRWSNETIAKALSLKFTCGNNGYQQLMKEKIPLPSLRTLSRRLEHLKFDSGILDEVFSFLKIKVDIMTEHEKDCVIVLDEMAISSSNVFDNSSKQFVGNVTLPSHSGIATQALAIMLGGITCRWKQTVAYYFTGKSTDGTVYEEIIFEIIQKAENFGLKVYSITSDMGSSNLALWRKWGIIAGRHDQNRNSISHPLDDDRRI